MPRPELSTLQLFASLTPAQRARALRDAARASNLPEHQLKALLASDWRIVGRPKQQPPPGDWMYWWLRAGRGFGKTLTGAQWAKKVVLRDDPGCRFKLVAPTQSDVRRTMVEGETGLLSVLPAAALLGQSREIAWNKTTLELRLANGTLFEGFSSERPDRLRGPQHGYAWCEEISSWNDAGLGDKIDTTWTNTLLSTRLSASPRFCITSTPKPNKLTKHLATIPGLVLVTGSSYENQANLAESWWREVVAPLEGTRTGRQEIEAEILEDVEGALWTASLLDRLRIPFPWPTGRRTLELYLQLAGELADREPHLRPPTDLGRMEVGVDPNASSGEAANSAGIIVAGVSNANGHGYVLDDRTTVKGGPGAWAAAAVNAYHDWEADRVVAEVNNGGDMVEMVIKNIDPDVPVKQVRASRGKLVRAEPVAAAYTGSEVVESRAHHVGTFPLLEGEMTTWTPGGESPDRMDALVWVLWNLLLHPRQTTEMRTARTRARIPTGADRFGIGGI